MSAKAAADQKFKIKLPGVYGLWHGVHSVQRGHRGLPYVRGNRECACGERRKVGKYVSCWSRYLSNKKNRNYGYRLALFTSGFSPLLPQNRCSWLAALMYCIYAELVKTQHKQCSI